jgi:hypothetical protein
MIRITIRFCLWVLLITYFLTSSCTINEFTGVPAMYRPLLEEAFIQAGENATELQNALLEANQKEKEPVAFLIAYMPERDLQSLTSEFILENVRYALKARNEFAWCKALPDSIFLNEVLPYVSLNERRDNWRADFYNRFVPLVKECTDIREAIDSVNMNIARILQVEYNTKRKKADQSPYESIEIGMASCSGLSILLTDAFRAVGIPSRIAGTPLWTNMRGNHSWCEVWIDGEWYFTEYYPDKLNHSWFLADAGKADPEKQEHWIYSSSFKPTGLSYPLVWDRSINYVPAENVTEKYIELYRQQLTNTELAEDEIILNVVLYNSSETTDGNNRITKKISVSTREQNIDFGYTPGPRDDLNRFLVFRLKKNTMYDFVIGDNYSESKTVSYYTGEMNNEVLRLSF